MIFHSYFLFCFHVREQREISIFFVFYRKYGCLFKRIKHLSTMHTFSSYSSFLSKFYGKRNESYSSCNVRNSKVDPLNEIRYWNWT